MSNVYFRFVAVAAAIAMALIASAAASAAADNVIVSQVLYNPAGTDSGGEAVELYNPADSAVNLSGWALATETSPTDATLPSTAAVCSRCHYLVADLNWSNAKDKASWPNADYEEAITLANTDAGVALKDATGKIVDAAGWGSAAGIGDGLFEGSPSSGSGNGNSLTRRAANGSYTDTNNNSNDFIEILPEFHNSSHGFKENGNAEIGVTIVVSGSVPMVSSLSVLTDDDAMTEGSQVSPIPWANKTVSVEAVISDANGASDIASATINFNGTHIAALKKSEVNSTAAVYSASFNLSSAFAPGIYQFTLIAVDNSGFSANLSMQFEYLSLAAVEIDASSVVFFAEPGAAYEIPGDQSISTASNITLANAGNVRLDFDVWSTNFTTGSGSIGASRLMYAFNGDYDEPSLAGVMSNAKIRKDVNLNPGFMAGLSLRLDMPAAALPGNYSGKISLVAVNS